MGTIGTLTPSQAQVAAMVTAAAVQYNIPPSIALGVANHESGFNSTAANKNTNGTVDYGVMQLNSTTVQTLGVQDPLDPQQNINAGVGLLAKYYQQYGNWDQALQAYASGPGTVASGAAPNSTATQFIGYVTSYDPSSVLGQIGMQVPSADSSPASPSLSSDGSVGDGSGDSSVASGIDWTTVGLIGAAAAAAIMLS